MNRNPLPDLVYLQECFEIDSNSPSGLIWKNRPIHHFSSEYIRTRVNGRWMGKPAGSLTEHGYFVLIVNRRKFMTHRIIYALFNSTTDFLSLDVDHINRKKEDNAPENLRLATHSQNNRNRPKEKKNKSGYKNIFWDKSKMRWVVTFKLNREQLRVGRFVDLEEAKKARDSFIFSRPNDFEFYFLDD